MYSDPQDHRDQKVSPERIEESKRGIRYVFGSYTVSILAAILGAVVAVIFNMIFQDSQEFDFITYSIFFVVYFLASFCFDYRLLDKTATDQNKEKNDNKA